MFECFCFVALLLVGIASTVAIQVNWCSPAYQCQFNTVSHSLMIPTIHTLSLNLSSYETCLPSLPVLTLIPHVCFVIMTGPVPMYKGWETYYLPRQSSILNFALFSFFVSLLSIFIFIKMQSLCCAAQQQSNTHHNHHNINTYRKRKKMLNIINMGSILQCTSTTDSKQERWWCLSWCA